MQGNALAFLALFGWLPFVIFLFIRMPAQRAVIIAVLGAWLFLPLSSMKLLPIVPPYDKMLAAFLGILIAAAIYDMERLQSFKLAWIDIPMVIWCVSPFMTSITNDLGPYDGLVNSVGNMFTWGLPYVVGRIYFNDFAGLRQLAVGIFIGGLLYILPCLYEMRLFTSLHLRIYGFILHNNFAMSIRYGGYRPSVFLTFGLAVGVWMMTAALMGIVLWRAKIIKEIWKIPIVVLVALLVVTFILVKSTGAYSLLAYALVILFVAKWFKTAILQWVFIIGICLYLYLGAVGQFPREALVSTLNQSFDAERIASLDYRFGMEEILSNKARERMLFGWGGFGRNRVYDDSGKDITVTDSLWIIVYGVNGAIGLIGAFGSLLLPVAAFCARIPARYWSHPTVAPAAALATGVVMYSLDCVLNAMVNPTYIMICGGLAGLVMRYEKT